MSSCHIKAAFHLEIPSSHKLVLLAICQVADKKDGSCFPGQKLLVQMTSLHIRTVQRSLEWLEEQNYIVRKERRRDSGYRTSDLYKLNFLGGTESPDTESGGGLSPDTEYDLRRQSVNSQAAQSQGNILSTRRSTSDPPDSMPKSENKYSDSFEEFWKTYPPNTRSTKNRTYTQYLKSTKEASHETIIQGTRGYSGAIKSGQQELQYVPDAYKWLKEERWTIDYSLIVRNSANAPIKGSRESDPLLMGAEIAMRRALEADNLRRQDEIFE